MFTLLTRVCSLCLNKERNLESMFNKDRNKISIQEKLHFCVSEMATPEEELPTLICTICTGHLNAFYSFKKMCLESKKKLRELINEEKQPTSGTNSTNSNFETIFLKNELARDSSNLNRNKDTKSADIVTPQQDLNANDSMSNESDDSNSNFEDQDNFENIPDIIEFKNEPLDDISGNNLNTGESFQNSENKGDEKKPIKCSECNKEFACKRGLANHIQMHSTISRYGFKCTVCQIKFPTQSELKQHWTIHADEYPFKCKICDKKFADEMTLSVHMGYHSVDRPYECPHCPKTFKDKWHLGLHVTIHSSERPYMCTICGKRFRQKGNLNEHINTHSGLKPFECDTCQKRFPDKKQLKRHMKTHLDIKPFICTMCDKRFKHKISLVNHTREHNDEKPFECRVCQKRFVRKVTLNRHEKSHEVS